jgi:hypothetical protein
MGDPFMSPEQLEAFHVLRKQRHQRWVERQRSNDLEGFLERARVTRLAWDHANKPKVWAAAARTRARAKASNAHRCETCQLSLDSITALRKHLRSKAHAEKLRLAAGGTPKPVTAENVRSRRFSSKNRTNKKFYCAIYDMPFGIKGHLDRHLASTRHHIKVAAASA